MAYGFVTYEVSEFMEGIGSRRAPFFLLLLPLLFSLPELGDLAGDRRVCPLAAFGVRTVEGLDSWDFALSWLMGGKLWKRQKT